MSTMDTHPGFSPACSVYTQWLLVSHLPKCGPHFMGSVWWQQALTEHPVEPESLCPNSPEYAAGNLWAWPYVKETIAHLERWELRGLEAPNGLALQQERVFSPILCSVEVG